MRTRGSDEVRMETALVIIILLVIAITTFYIATR